MTLPPIGAIGSVLSPSALAGLGPGEASGVGAGARVGGFQSAGGLSLSTPAAGAEQTAGAGEVAGVSGTGSAAGLEGAGGASNPEAGGFGEALTHAISSLEQSQTSGDHAARALATGTASNPESAVVTVADAQLTMQLASQIRTKTVEAAPRGVGGGGGGGWGGRRTPGGGGGGRGGDKGGGG
ncbi:MAG: flagellar hook-basal body complex protein FliE, partial [Solirubrobacterales bacterium]